MYSIENEQRELGPYDNKRYLLATLPDGRPNPNINAYCHRDLAANNHIMADQPEPDATLIIRNPEDRLAWRHALVSRRLKLAAAIKMEQKLPDGDADCQLNGHQLLVAERVTFARQNSAIRIGDAI